MSSKKTKVVEVDPRIAESLPFLRHATKLYNDYVARAPPPAVHDIQLCRFGDYLKHFGFALEKELPHNPLENTLKGSKRLPPLFPEEQEVDPEAAWGISEPLVTEADARSAEADVAAILSSESPTMVEEVAKAITLPFERISRTQSATQSALKKARCLYTWLATNVNVTLDEVVPTTPAVAARTGPKAKSAPKAPKKENKKKGGSKDRKGTEVAAEDEALPPNPLCTALVSRLATPFTMARLYEALLFQVGVRARVVEGVLKGPSAEETLNWAWNIVSIDEKSYLVDIAYSCYNGALRRPKPESKPVESVAAKGKGSRANAAAKKETSKKEEAPPPVCPSEPSVVPPGLSLTKPPKLTVWRRKVEDFYFFTNPLQFVHTHLPSQPSDALLLDPPSNVAWDLAPRQTHSIFQFGISLVSHRRNQCFTVRSAPFYLTFKNEAPANIQLCCALYKCSLWELPEDLKEITPLGSEWVWHQRRESDNTETFTITVPDGGFYSAVVGARYIREDPYTSHISDIAFTPIVEYQMKVNFVPIATPTFPRQHLSPNLCRLMTPLSRNILAGPHRFAVMPSCSNVVAVALVRYTPPAADPLGELGEVVEDLKSGTRDIIQFLQFNSAIVTYEGEAMLDPSTIVEVWILYRAPDKNGFTFQEKVAIQEKEKQPTPPPTPPPQGKSKKQVKRKAPVADVASLEEVEMTKLLGEIAAGRAFLPFVSGIQAKSILTRETGGIIQPQPSVQEEMAPVMRRLAGITPSLYHIASELQSHQYRPVGGYYDGRRNIIDR